MPGVHASWWGLQDQMKGTGSDFWHWTWSSQRLFLSFGSPPIRVIVIGVQDMWGSQPGP